MTGLEMRVSGGMDSGGTASVSFEKSHKLRVARGTCIRGGRGRRSVRTGDTPCSDTLKSSWQVTGDL